MRDSSPCPFCHLPNPSSAQRCGGCGGPLQRTPTSLLIPVPPAPRATNWKLLRSDPGSSFMLLFGAIFGGIGGGLGLLFIILGVATLVLPMAGAGLLVFLIFGGIGGGCFGWGFYRARSTHQLWVNGVAVEGRVLSVEENHSVRINGRHPWIVRYSFPWIDGQKEAESSILDPRLRTVQEETALQIIVNPNDPTQSLVYVG
jgi:hypothetical protein